MLSKRAIMSIILITTILASIIPVSASTLLEQNEGNSVIKMQMKPIVEKYENMKESDISAKEFKDIKNHYGETNVKKMAAVGVISGYPNGNFGPNDTLLADQYLTMIIRALGYKPEIAPGQEYWMWPAEKAKELNLIRDGEIENFIMPINRELAAVIAFRTLMLYETRPKDEEVYFNYNVAKIYDYYSINDQYKNDVVLAYRMGLIQGYNNLFDPKGTLTRAQGCIIVNRLIDKTIRTVSVPQPHEVVTFKNADCNEYLFYPAKMNPNKIYTFMPGTFPLNEIFEVVKTLIEQKYRVKGGYIVQRYNEDTKNFYTELYKNKEKADQFYFIDPRIPTASVKFSIRTEKVYQEGALSDKGSGFLYSLNVWDCSIYDKYMKEYTYAILRTLFENDADKAIALHDKYLRIALEGLQGSYESTTLNGRYMSIGSGRNGFYIEIYAKGAIK